MIVVTVSQVCVVTNRFSLFHPDTDAENGQLRTSYNALADRRRMLNEKLEGLKQKKMVGQ